LQFDVPAKCASLLQDKSVDLGLIPSIEYLRNQSEYRIVPDIAVASKGPVESVALFTDRPPMSLRSIAVDASSRTSAALLRVLCAQWFDIEPTFVTLRPDLPVMLKRCDAALLIGDAALHQDHEALGLDKVDLGEEWLAMTGLPFVWAVWAGREHAVTAEHLQALRAARDAGVAALDEIADRFAVVPDSDDAEGELAARAREYLHENVFYTLDEDGRAGLKKFFTAASELEVVPSVGPLRFFE
jgi:predicted solute-binding protein